MLFLNISWKNVNVEKREWVLSGGKLSEASSHRATVLFNEKKNALKACFSVYLPLGSNLNL